MSDLFFYTAQPADGVNVFYLEDLNGNKTDFKQIEAIEQTVKGFQLPLGTLIGTTSYSLAKRFLEDFNHEIVLYDPSHAEGVHLTPTSYNTYKAEWVDFRLLAKPLKLTFGPLVEFMSFCVPYTQYAMATITPTEYDKFSFGSEVKRRIAGMAVYETCSNGKSLVTVEYDKRDAFLLTDAHKFFNHKGEVAYNRSTYPEMFEGLGVLNEVASVRVRITGLHQTVEVLDRFGERLDQFDTVILGNTLELLGTSRLISSYAKEWKWPAVPFDRDTIFDIVALRLKSHCGKQISLRS